MKCIIFDIDGTLADCSHRQHHVQGRNKDWNAFYEGIPDDVPNEGVVFLNKIIAELDYSLPVLVCSGRPDNYREQTETWLNKYGIFYQDLFMRPAGDFRPDYTVKSHMLDKILEDGYEPVFVVDDRPSVVKMWRERGLTCLQCNDDWNEPRNKIWGRLTLLVGPSGAGKSHWRLQNVNPREVLSSDSFRIEICGDLTDQSKNDQVFAALHAIAKARLSNGLDVTIDATNIKRADRLANVSLVPDYCPVEYIVIDRPLDQKLRDGGWRLDVRFPDGRNLIEKHDQTFKSQLKEILRGDGLPNVTVRDLR